MRPRRRCSIRCTWVWPLRAHWGLLPLRAQRGLKLTAKRAGHSSKGRCRRGVPKVIPPSIGQLGRIRLTPPGREGLLRSTSPRGRAPGAAFHAEACAALETAATSTAGCSSGHLGATPRAELRPGFEDVTTRAILTSYDLLGVIIHLSLVQHHHPSRIRRLGLGCTRHNTSSSWSTGGRRTPYIQALRLTARLCMGKLAVREESALLTLDRATADLGGLQALRPAAIHARPKASQPHGRVYLQLLRELAIDLEDLLYQVSILMCKSTLSSSLAIASEEGIAAIGPGLALASLNLTALRELTTGLKDLQHQVFLLMRKPTIFTSSAITFKKGKAVVRLGLT